MIRQVITDALLVLAVLTVAAAALGVAVMPDAYARLHYVTPAAVVAPVLVALAIFVTEGLDENTGETVLALVFMIATGPFLAHATIRAMRVRERGDWRVRSPGAVKPEQVAPEVFELEEAGPRELQPEEEEPQASESTSAREGR